MYKGTILALFAIAGALSLIDFSLSKEAKGKSGTSSDHLPKDWIKFVPFTGKFSIYLPKTPKYAIDVVNVPNTDSKRWYEMYASEEVDGTVFLINLISYQTFDPKNLDSLLHNVVNEITSSNINNNVLEIKDGTFQGRKSVFFHIQNESIEVRGVVFLEEITVYQLSYTALKDNFNENEYEMFVNSFELVKPSNTPGDS